MIPDVAHEWERARLYADIGGVAEVAKALNVSIHRVKRWIERANTTQCPRPVRSLRSGNVYSIDEWRGWFEEWMLTRGVRPYRSGRKFFGSG